MKKINILVITLVAVLTFSCSSDDANPEITANDFAKTIDENQLNNSEIGNLEANSNDGKLSYMIINQSPTGSLAIDSSNGMLTVADETAFDFETNPTITASIELKSKSLTKTVNATITLNDIDDLEFYLSDSKTAYTAAADDDWVLITENEYNTLNEKLNNVSVHGSTSSEFNHTGNIELGTSNGWTVANINPNATIPDESYIFAFKYEIQGDNITGTQVKQSSTSNYSGFENVGSTLPVHSSTNSKMFYFVIKNNDMTTTALGYMGLYKADGSKLSFKRQPGTYHWSSSDVNNLEDDFYGNDGSTGIRWLHQGLSTTQKQW